MEENKANPSVPVVRGVEHTEEFVKFSDAVNKLNELIDYVPEEDRRKVKASILTRLTNELNLFIEGGEIVRKHREAEYDKEIEVFAKMINKVIADEMEIIRKKYSLAGEILPDFYSLEFHGYRASIIGHINNTVLKGTRFLLVVKRTQIESAIVEGLEDTGYKPKEGTFDVHYSLALVDKFKDLLEEAQKENVVEAPTTAKKPDKKTAKKK